MKWMGGWSYQDLDDSPTEIRDEIIQMINEEAEEYARARGE